MARRHSWEKHDNRHKTCRDCGISVLARPHPYQRRWYHEYTIADGRCFTSERVPPCQPAVQPQPSPEDERVRHASELDRAAGRAWQQGDLQRAARPATGVPAPRPTRIRTPISPPGGPPKSATPDGATTATRSAISVRTSPPA
jgi:hypothetical protein